ncbi:MAG: HEAT repeat domain-containing protein [Gemmatimonadota bacterium]|nr:HEAT repeat domain-containing protein [Gemmatimonadota bacterium]
MTLTRRLAPLLAAVAMVATVAACTAPSTPKGGALSSGAPSQAAYFDTTGRRDVYTGGVRMIPITTPKGTFNVWTKRVGNNPTVKLLLLHGGPGMTHEYFESADAYLPAGGVEYYYYDQLGSFYSDQPNDVCPYNRKFSKELSEGSPFRPRLFLDGVPSRELALRVLGMGVPEYTELFRGSAMKRAKLAGLRRNAAVVLGNTGSVADLPALIIALGDELPLVRGHAAWAVGRIGSDAGVAALRERLAVEPDESVRAEIESALRAADDAPDEISRSRGT